MSNIRIDIASEFKDKGFKAADKRTTSLNRKFDKLARTAKSTFIAIAGIQALKRSVVAFAEEDQAANKLGASLRNLGLAYDTQAIEDYLERSEKATAISKDELSPAIAGLLSTTLSAEKSMNLLNLAMDVSTSTGRDLTSVTVALSRAYNGNFASLGKLQTAFTSAELEAMGFEKSVEALNGQFGGAAENNANTYAGKIDKLKIAFGDLAEEIGAGIVAFLESLGSGDYDNGLQKLVNFGQAIGDVFRRAGLSIEYTKALLATGFRIDAAEQFKLDELRAQLANPRAGDFGVSRGNLNDYKQQLALQKKIEADRKKAAALAAQSEKLKLKNEKEALQLKRAGTVFDLENIQIVAALQGKVTEEQRLRLTALLAINNENADAAFKLTQAIVAIQKPALDALGITIKTGDQTKDLINSIIDAQTRLFLLNTGIANIPDAKNPFDNWGKVLKKLNEDIDEQIIAKLTTLPAANNPFAAWDSIIDMIEDRIADMMRNINSLTDGTSAKKLSDLLTESQKNAFVYNLAIGLTNLAFPDPTVLDPDTFAYEFGTAFTEFQNMIMSQLPNITVNVSGSVITEADLNKQITAAILQYQKSGQLILWSANP